MTTHRAKIFKNNQERGRDLEKRFMSYLYKQGFWVHFMHPAPDGSQPFDIIAIRSVKENVWGSVQVCAFDCKTLEGDRFPFDRVEDNQKTAFQVLNKRGVHNTYFVVEIGLNRVILIPSQYIEELIQKGEKSLKIEEEYKIASICIE